MPTQAQTLRLVLDWIGPRELPSGLLGEPTWEDARVWLPYFFFSPRVHVQVGIVVPVGSQAELQGVSFCHAHFLAQWSHSVALFAFW